MAGTERHVALLRGVNVAGKNRVPMKDLVAVFEGVGCASVATYIQSGNVVFAPPGGVEGLAARLADAIEARFGFASPVVLRSASALAAVPRATPFPGLEDQTHVMFLAEAPDPAAVAALDPDRSPGDRFAVVGRDVFLHLPHGVGRTKLTNDWFDRKLANVGTVRNWRTVLALIDLAR